MSSRPAFIDLLRQANKPLLGTSDTAITKVLGRDHVTLQRICRDFVSEGNNVVDDFSGCLEASGVQDAVVLTLDGLGRGARQFNKSNKRERSKLLASTIQGQLDSTQKQAFIDQARASRYLTCRDEAKGRDFLLFAPQPLRDEAAENDDTVEIVAQIYGEPRTLTVPAVLASLAPNSMVPRMVWSVDSEGERRFVFGNDEEAGTLRQRHYIDNFLGGLLVAYCSPEVREKWPKSVGGMGIDYRQRGQVMGPAQVPVFALLDKKLPGEPVPHRQQLLDSEFIAAVEALAA